MVSHKPRFGGGNDMEEHDESNFNFNTSPSNQGEELLSKGDNQTSYTMQEQACGRTSENGSTNLQTKMHGACADLNATESGNENAHIVVSSENSSSTSFERSQQSFDSGLSSLPTSSQKGGTPVFYENQTAKETNIPQKIGLASSETDLYCDKKKEIFLNGNVYEDNGKIHHCEDKERFKIGKTKYAFIDDEINQCSENLQSLETKEVIAKDELAKDVYGISDKSVQSDDSSVFSWKESNVEKLDNLLKSFESLGIKSKPRLYTRLPHDQALVWRRYFLDNSIIQDDTTTSSTSPTTPAPHLGNFENASVENNICYCKNLFLKDRKGQFYLVIAEEWSKIDLKQLKQQLNASRNLSFVVEEEMMNILGLRPGEVTPFAIMNDSARNVKVAVHESLSNVLDSSNGGVPLAFHPFSHLLQVEISFDELNTFVTHLGKQLILLGRSDSSESASQKKNSDSFKGCTLQQSITKQSKKNKTGFGERKGKLKSYIKKNSNQAIKDGVHDPSGAISANESLNLEKVEKKTVGEGYQRGEVGCKSKDLDREGEGEKLGRNDLSSYSPTRRLPEIDEFYEALSRHSIRYREINVSSETSKEIGPALGAKCFLFVDKRDNYFLVISHEFYEPDYGRLRKALRPKKKLNECSDAGTILDILGVDCQHFTPFSVMNSRSRNNSVNVFVTKKISLPNIILCIQHPFARGRRILMSSFEFQRFLVNFSSTSSVGIVDEKEWLARYNSVFTQFNHLDDLSLESPKSGFKRETNLNSPTFNNSLNGNFENLNTKKCSDDVSISETKQNSETHAIYFTAKTQVNKSDYSVFHQILSKLNSGVSSLLEKLSSAKSNVSNNSAEQYLDGAGTCIDGAYYIDKKTKINKSFGSNYSKTIPCLGNKQTSTNDFTGLIENTNENELEEFESVDPEEKYSQPSLYRSASVETLGKVTISVEDIFRLLNKNNIVYSVLKDGSDDVARESDDFDNDDETMSQDCYTLHLTNASESTHYIIVGRDREHIPVKRFRRRFCIQESLFIKDDDEGRDPGSTNYKSHSFPFKCVNKNPFSVYLETARSQASGTGRRGRGVKYELVLFSSIYMDPDMECVFTLDHLQGVRLCLSSRELETYARIVGMDVRYMP